VFERGSGAGQRARANAAAPQNERRFGLSTATMAPASAPIRVSRASVLSPTARVEYRVELAFLERAGDLDPTDHACPARARGGEAAAVLGEDHLAALPEPGQEQARDP